MKNKHVMKTKYGHLSITVCFVMLLMLVSVTSCNKQGVTSFDEKETEEALKEISKEVSKEDDEPYAQDGDYQVDITMEGGSGKASIYSPVDVKISNGEIKAVLIWNSVNYDYMIIDGVRYDNENPGGESTFTVPVDSLQEPLKVIADTVAMSKPHEIEYTINWNSSDGSVKAGDDLSSEDEGLNMSWSERAFGSEDLGTLQYTGDTEFLYATGLKIRHFGDYRLICIAGDADYLVIPEGLPVPEDVPEDVTVLKRPIDATYLVSSSAMDIIRQCECMDNIRLSAVKAEDWYVKEAAEAMNDGGILYAGKYSAPDYELILREGCDLAVENTMIYHKPEVKEKLKELGIPVMVEHSSYESHPLGRLEWIKLYGALYDKEEVADKYFKDQLNKIEPIMQMDNTGVKAVIFSVTDSGMINVKGTDDYTAKMIEMAGGEYITPDEGNGSITTGNMQMEDFYAAASDADVLIYNSTISGEIGSVDELIKKNGLFEDFKAVKNKRVYCTGRDLFQKITGMADFIADLHAAFKDEDKEYTYLNRLD